MALLAISANIPPCERGKPIALRGVHAIAIPDVAEAVKTAFVIRPNQNHE
jgi:hypothetical protein